MRVAGSLLLLEPAQFFQYRDPTPAVLADGVMDGAIGRAATRSTQVGRVLGLTQRIAVTERLVKDREGGNQKEQKPRQERGLEVVPIVAGPEGHGARAFPLSTGGRQGRSLRLSSKVEAHLTIWWSASLTRRTAAGTNQEWSISCS